jgi:hypothetical protein
VDTPTALAADLATLTRALGNPDTDIEASMRLLDAALHAAIDSYLGLSIRSAAGGAPVGLTAVHDPARPGPVRSSLRIPLVVLGTSGPGDALLFYAANPGAFVDLAADVTWALTVEHQALFLDEDLTVDLSTPTGSGLAAMSAINQAIGALMAQGLPAEAAAVELRHRAEAHNGSLDGAARHLITELTTQLEEPDRPLTA